MCRLMGFVSRRKTTFPLMAGVGFENFVALSAIHCDGWGVATIDHGENKAHLVRAAEMAQTSKEFDAAIANSSSDGGMLHLRWATKGLPVSENNAHPFIYQDFSFIHNGSINPPSSLEPFISQKYAGLIQGQTDSERYFYMALSKIEEYGFVEGVKRTAELIIGSCDYSSINSMAMNESTFIVISEHFPERRPDFGGPDYYQLKYRIDADGVIVASTGWPQDGWKDLPNHHMLVVDRESFEVQVIEI